MQHLPRLGEDDVVVAGALEHGHAVDADLLAEARLQLALQLLELRHSVLYALAAGGDKICRENDVSFAAN